MGTNRYNYMYDPIANRMAASANAVSNLYTANELNQYVAISNSQSQQLMYDNDGNLTNDGVFAFSWNGENRLIKIETTDAATNAGVPKVKCEFAYDYMGRRFRKTVGSDYSGGTYATTNVTTFVYDGWNLIAATETTVADTNMTYFVNGLDLSGSLQGAGGIGGLLAVIEDDGETYFPAFDGNGNVTEYVDTNGTIVAHREYTPFGQTIAATGTKKNDFAHWFSTKYEDAETGLYYYGYRFYNPENGRWINRDPVEELGGLCLYIFVYNNSLNYLDLLGLTCEHCEKAKKRYDDAYVRAYFLALERNRAREAAQYSAEICRDWRKTPGGKMIVPGRPRFGEPIYRWMRREGETWCEAADRWTESFNDLDERVDTLSTWVEEYKRLYIECTKECGCKPEL